MRVVTSSLAAILLVGLAATATEAAGDRFWDRESFRGARNAYQRDLQARRDWDRRHDRDDHRRSHWRAPPRIHLPPPVVIYRSSPPVIFVEPVGPIHVVPVSPLFIDGLGRTCLEVRTSTSYSRAEGYAIACLHADGTWRLVS
jgi:hypothetical protein